jgi:hypothetical protein
MNRPREPSANFTRNSVPSGEAVSAAGGFRSGITPGGKLAGSKKASGQDTSAAEFSGSRFAFSEGLRPKPMLVTQPVDQISKRWTPGASETSPSSGSSGFVMARPSTAKRSSAGWLIEGCVSGGILNAPRSSLKRRLTRTGS